MAEKAQVLRQALNKVDVWGYAQESTLAVKSFNDKVTGQPYTCIAGDVTIKTGDDETHVIAYFAKELTKDGAVSKNFKSLQTAMEEMVTVADIAQGIATGEPSMLTCQGELALNEFKTQAGEVVSNARINGKFAPSRFKGEKSEFTPKAEYTIEGIVYKTVMPEIVNDEETGRLKIELYVPLYAGKIIPLSFLTLPTLPQNQKDYLEENFTKGASIKIWGKLVNKSKKIERVIEAGFGEDTVETTYERTREFITIGGALYEVGVHDGQVFDTSLLKEAIANRERYLASLVAKDNAPQQQQNTAGFGGATQTAPQTPPQQTAPQNDLDDLFGED